MYLSAFEWQECGQSYLYVKYESHVKLHACNGQLKSISDRPIWSLIRSVHIARSCPGHGIQLHNRLHVNSKTCDNNQFIHVTSITWRIYPADTVKPYLKTCNGLYMRLHCDIQLLGRTAKGQVGICCRYFIIFTNTLTFMAKRYSRYEGVYIWQCSCTAICF